MHPIKKKSSKAPSDLINISVTLLVLGAGLNSSLGRSQELEESHSPSQSGLAWDGINLFVQCQGKKKFKAGQG